MRFSTKEKLRRTFYATLDAAGYVCPAAGRYVNEMRARDAFRMATRGSFLGPIGLGLTQKFLEKAGHDIRADKPYKEVLGFEGGREAFENLAPEKYRTAQYLPSLEPRGRS